jgi:TfoX/Sxy family transcriptional regulator of competence genes
MAPRKGESPVRKLKPASREWMKVFGEAAAGIEGGEQRKMFGYPALFARGKLAASLHETGMVLRLPEAERESFLRLEGAKQFEPMPGRIMREYVVAPSTLSKRPDEVSAWLRKAFAYASALPEKSGARGQSKARKPRGQG